MRRTTLIRVSTKTRKKLKRKSYENDVPMGRILERLVDDSIIFNDEKNEKPKFRF